MQNKRRERLQTFPRSILCDHLLLIVEYSFLLVVSGSEKAWRPFVGCHAFPVIEAGMKSRAGDYFGEYSLWNTFTRKIIISNIRSTLKRQGLMLKQVSHKYLDAHLVAYDIDNIVRHKLGN